MKDIYVGIAFFVIILASPWIAPLVKRLIAAMGYNYIYVVVVPYLGFNIYRVIMDILEKTYDAGVMHDLSTALLIAYIIYALKND